MAKIRKIVLLAAIVVLAIACQSDVEPVSGGGGSHSEFGVSRTYRTSKIYTRKDYNGVINYK